MRTATSTDCFACRSAGNSAEWAYKTKKALPQRNAAGVLLLYAGQSVGNSVLFFGFVGIAVFVSFRHMELCRLEPKVQTPSAQQPDAAAASSVVSSPSSAVSSASAVSSGVSQRQISSSSSSSVQQHPPSGRSSQLQALSSLLSCAFFSANTVAAEAAAAAAIIAAMMVPFMSIPLFSDTLCLL